MAEEPGKFKELMERIKAHSDGAVRELLEKYGAHIHRIVRRRLNPLMRSKFDSADFVQAVWVSFFALPLDQYRFDQSATLAEFLAGIANHKIIDSIRQRLQTQKSGIAQERSLDALPGGAGQQAVAREPSPEEIAMAKEEWAKVLEGKKPQHQEVLVALGEGATAREVAEATGFSEKTIQRILHRARSQRKL